MTIAVSVVVKPSRMLRIVLALLCAGVLAVGISLVCGMVGDMSFSARLACLLLCSALAAGGFFHIVKRQHPYRLDISGTGQIRLISLPEDADCADICNNHPHPTGMLVTLLPDSTLWPRFLILRLQDESRRIYALSIWPHSVSTASFRALAVACRWIAAHRFAQ
jgi:hypothetical protein